MIDVLPASAVQLFQMRLVVEIAFLVVLPINHGLMMGVGQKSGQSAPVFMRPVFVRVADAPNVYWHLLMGYV